MTQHPVANAKTSPDDAGDAEKYGGQWYHFATGPAMAQAAPTVVLMQVFVFFVQSFIAVFYLLFNSAPPTRPHR